MIVDGWKALLESVCAALVGALGSDDWQTREYAHQTTALCAHVLDWREPLRRALQSPDPEVRHRARSIVADFEDVRPLRGYFPRIEMVEPLPGLESYHEALLRQAEGYQEFQNRNHFFFRVDYQCRRHTEEYALACLRAGYSRGKVAAMLEKAHQKDPGDEPRPMPDGFRWDDE